MSDATDATRREAGRFRERFEQLESEIHKVIVGQDAVVDGVLTALFAGGHVLLEGVPGIGKTMLVKTLGDAMHLSKSRVQFTPDLMPADVVGTMVLDEGSGGARSVRFQPGPIHANLVLADEINRATPKTQSALLEAMQERQVSLDGDARPLPDPFLVVATQNPIEQQGTYPLPEAQLDRFLFKLEIGYPSPDEEDRILTEQTGVTGDRRDPLATVAAVASAEELAAARDAALTVQVREEVRRYLLEIVRRTRDDVHLQVGASPRAGVMLQLGARVQATLEGRDFVIPDDVRSLVLPALRHRVVPTAAAEIEGVTADDALTAIVESVDVPR